MCPGLVERFADSDQLTTGINLMGILTRRHNDEDNALAKIQAESDAYKERLAAESESVDREQKPARRVRGRSEKS